LISLFIFAMIFVSCQTKPKVDMTEPKNAVAKILDDHWSALKAKDADAVIALVSEDFLSCGSDPKEFWNKTEMYTTLKQMLANSDFKFDITVDKREIRVSKDGNSAIAFEQKPFALTLMQGLTSGRLKISAIHGDTKLENFLFSKRTGKAKSLIDLDTIMPHTWLSDWGDMVRSLVNAAGEKERDIQKIEVDMEVFQAVARGFLGAARSISSEEAGLMIEAAQIMSLELGIRFLADYIRGDNYFRLSAADPPDLNKTRALVQFAVFEKLQDKKDIAKEYIRRLLAQQQI